MVISSRDQLVAIGLLILAMALWGSAFVAMKKALAVSTIADIMFYRLALASMAMLPFVLSRPQRWPNLKDALMLSLLGILEPVLYFLFESLALQYTTASQGGLVFALLPLAIMSMTALLYRRWPTARLSVAGLVAAAAVGVATIGADGGSERAPAPELGNMLEVMAVLSAAVFTVMADRLLSEYSPELLALFQCVFGTICFGAYWLVTHDSLCLPGHAIGYIIYLGLIVTGGAYFAFNNAIQKLSGQIVGPFYATVPIFSLLTSAIWTGGRLSPEMMLAIGLSIAAIAIITNKKSMN